MRFVIAMSSFINTIDRCKVKPPVSLETIPDWIMEAGD